MKYQSFFIAFNFCDTSKEISTFLTNVKTFCYLQKMSLVLANSNDFCMYITFCFISVGGGNVFWSTDFDPHCKSHWKSRGSEHINFPLVFHGFCKTIEITKDQWYCWTGGAPNDFLKWLGAKKCHWSNVLMVVLQNHWNYQGPVTCF